MPHDQAVTPSSPVLDVQDRRAQARALRRGCDVLVRDVRRSVGIENPELLHDLVDALAAAVELDTVDAFVHHATATAAAAEARGVPRTRLADVFAALRACLAATPSATAVRCVDEAQLALDEPRFVHDVSAPPRAFRRERDAYLRAAIAGEWRSALAIVERALAEGHPLLDVYADLVGEALYEVGRRWARNEITVTDQHIASSVSEYVLSRLYSSLHVEAPPAPAAVVACAPKEAHQTGAHIVADALELDGWDVRYLGAAASVEEVIDAVDHSGARLVAVSVALLPAAPRAAQLIEALRARFAAGAPGVIAGGAIVRAVPGLWRALGADGFAPDVRGAAGAARAAAA
jgi:methanogenic corrinoid protein MtbC1